MTCYLYTTGMESEVKGGKGGGSGTGRVRKGKEG